MADTELLEAIKKVAPGTPLREALDNIMRARTGALLVLGDGPKTMELVDGGVRLDAEFSPSLLYEVAKMDGAIILDRNVERVVYANASLWPRKEIPSQERGIRHRTGERVAIQTGEVVIAISQRRNVITIYQGQCRYVLRDIEFILAKANQALQTLSHYRSAVDRVIRNLDRAEIESSVCLGDVASVLRRLEMLWRIVEDIERYVVELGSEGHLVKMQMEEVVADLWTEHTLIIRDYALRDSSPEEAIREYRSHAGDVPLASHIAESLGYSVRADYLSLPVLPKGHRALRKVPRLPGYARENLVRVYGSLLNIMKATPEELDRVDGIGEARAKAISEGLSRFRREAGSSAY